MDLVTVYLKSNKLDEASLIVKSIVDLRIREQALGNLAIAYVKQGDLKTADELTDKIIGSIESKIFRSEILTNLAKAYAETGDLEQARLAVLKIPDDSDKLGAYAQIFIAWEKQRNQ